jgi:hypothetical protein
MWIQVKVFGLALLPKYKSFLEQIHINLEIDVAK